MIYKKSGPPNTPLVPVTYEFLAPTRVVIRSQDGQEILVGYGIGERIEVLEPRVQHLVALHEVLDEIPLADGRTIIGWKPEIRTRQVWPEMTKADNERGIPI